MKQPLKHITSLALATTLITSAIAQEKTTDASIKTMPPSVVKTVPQAGDTAVDPALKEIKVTFSKDMITDRMWSFCQISKKTFPESAGKIHYLADKRTCVMPVKLEPGKTYVIWINRAQYNSFRDTDNHPSVPYLLVFQTLPKP